MKFADSCARPSQALKCAVAEAKLELAVRMGN